MAPDGQWSTWLVMAGRFFGKTRTGAEWIRERGGSGKAKFIALIAPTVADARDVVVEGPAGILAIHPDHERPIYEPSKRRLTWPNGAIATTYSTEEPERLRGPQHDTAWCDEAAAWRYSDAFDMLAFGMRIGSDPHVLVTTTPRPVKLVHDLHRLFANLLLDSINMLFCVLHFILLTISARHAPPTFRKVAILVGAPTRPADQGELWTNACARYGGVCEERIRAERLGPIGDGKVVGPRSNDCICPTAVAGRCPSGPPQEVW